tara:strand:- start:757 stop:1986 length:1230 start_codon:yes stop_codon:yes gene_type:complete
MPNPSANALNAMMTATQFGQQQEDRLNQQRQQRDAQGLVNTENKIATLMAPGGGGREQAQRLALGSGDAGIITNFQNQIAGLDQASRDAATGRAEALGGLAISLAQQPYEARVNALQTPQVQDFLRGNGFSPEQIASFDPTDANIQTQMGMLGEVQSALTTGLEAVTLGRDEVRAQPGRESLVNPNAAIQQGIDRTEAQARLMTAQTGQRAEARQLQALENELANGQPVSQTDIRALRGEFEDEFARPFEDAQDQFLAMRNAAQDATGASDVALVFSFFKTIDPRSTVREGEFATAANTMGLGGRIVQSLERLDNGQILLPQLRQELIQAAENAIREREATVENARLRYTDLATRANMNPQDIVRETSRLGGSVNARAQALGATMADVEHTAQQEGMTIEQVLEALEQR